MSAPARPPADGEPPFATFVRVTIASVPDYAGAEAAVDRHADQSFPVHRLTIVGTGLRSVEQLQMVFGYRHAHSYPVRVFIPGVNKLFDAEGRLIDGEIDRRLEQQVAGFLEYIACLGR